MFKIYHTENEIYHGLRNLEYAIQKRPKNNAQKTKFKRNDSVKKRVSFVGYFTSFIVN